MNPADRREALTIGKAVEHPTQLSLARHQDTMLRATGTKVTSNLSGHNTLLLLSKNHSSGMIKARRRISTLHHTKLTGKIQTWDKASTRRINSLEHSTAGNSNNSNSRVTHGNHSSHKVTNHNQCSKTRQPR